MSKEQIEENELNDFVQFKGQKIRRVFLNDEWWFSVVDVIKVLTESQHAKTYWAKIRERDEGLSESFPFWEQLKMESSDGKKYDTDCSNTEGIFRIIQSIPSPYAEPFKRWLAKVGYERMQEIANPELAMDRMKMIYEKKGYPKDWIDKSS